MGVSVLLKNTKKYRLCSAGRSHQNRAYPWLRFVSAMVYRSIMKSILPASPYRLKNCIISITQQHLLVKQYSSFFDVFSVVFYRYILQILYITHKENEKRIRKETPLRILLLFFVLITRVLTLVFHESGRSEYFSVLYPHRFHSVGRFYQSLSFLERHTKKRR